MPALNQDHPSELERIADQLRMCVLLACGAWLAFVFAVLLLG